MYNILSHFTLALLVIWRGWVEDKYSCIWTFWCMWVI